MERGISLTVLVVAVGAAIGAGWLVDRAQRGDDDAKATREVAPKPAPPPLAVEAAPVAPAASKAADAADLLSQRLGEKIDAATQTAVRERATALRKQLLDAAAIAEATAANQIAEEIRKERAERADRMRGGTIAFLRGLERNWLPQGELVRSAERFGALFARKTDAGAIDGATLSYSSPPPDGTTIRFAAGQFALDVRAMNSWRPFPKDLVLSGAGMNATLLTMNDELRTADPVHSLTLRDLTIHTADNYLEANRNNPYTIRVERCRIIGFDCGAGGSSMLAGSVGAFYATDSRIEASFGRAPGFGNLFDVRGALLVRLENCDVTGPFRSVEQGASRTTQVFSNCRLTNLPSGLKYVADGKTRGSEYPGCTFGVLAVGQEKTASAKRSVAEINPAWKDPKR